MREAGVSLRSAQPGGSFEISAAEGVMGDGIHDALLAHCALKAGAETIYTWNVKHFKRLGPDIARRVSTP